MNSQEENNIITSKPVQRGERKKQVNYDNVKGILEYDSHESSQEYKRKRKNKILKKEDEDVFCPVKVKREKKMKAKQFKDEEEYDQRNDLY